jgi:hypothetical protein
MPAVTTAAKIAIGCVVACVGAGIVLSVLVGVGAYWAKGKIEQKTQEFTGELEKIQTLQRQVDAYPFTPPADGLIQEERLVRFLNVRKGVHAVYAANLAEFEKIKGEPQGLEALKTLGKTAVVLQQLRVAVLEGLARERMSEAEYRYLVGEVYRTAGAAAVASATSGRTAAEATEQGMSHAAEALSEGQAALEGLSPEVRDQLKAVTEQLGAAVEQANAASQQLEVPAANVELFNRYKDDIAKYAMTGLEAIGF